MHLSVLRWPSARRTAAALVALLSLLTVAACTHSPASSGQRYPHMTDIHYRWGQLHAHPLSEAAAAGITKIKHIVIVTQENRSFDTYFGTYPGADGFGKPVKDICVPDPGHHCVHPFHSRHDVSAGGPHGYQDTRADIDHGRMDGFVRQAVRAQQQCTALYDPACAPGAPRSVMSYYDNREVPDYWSLARHYVLQDHFFEASNDWSFPEHLYEVSGWSAVCKTVAVASCHYGRKLHVEIHHPDRVILAWTDITYLLHAYGVSWRYYVETGDQPDCINPHAIVCPLVKQTAVKPSVWNPMPQFESVQEDHQLHDVQYSSNFFKAAHRGTLPDVSWVVPNGRDSDHPPARVSDAQAWVAKVVDAVMHSPDWKSTAIFLNWDDWGGYYDGVRPPKVDRGGYGLRVPAMVISPYAIAGHVDHQTLSTDAYLKFIEDRWLGGQRLDPRTDGRADPRPDVRENKQVLGDLLNDFDFRQAPRPGVPVPLRPRTDLTEPPGFPPPTVACPFTCLKVLKGTTSKLPFAPSSPSAHGRHHRHHSGAGRPRRTTLRRGGVRSRRTAGPSPTRS